MFGRLFLLALAAALPLAGTALAGTALAGTALAGTALAGTALAASGDETRVPWRIRFLEAAVVAGPAVLLGEVAVPVGDMPAATWRELAARELWPAPAQEKRPLNMTRPRLQEAVVRSMNDLAPYCLFPGSLALQRGGAVLTREQIRDSVENQLRPALAVLPGEASLNDFRLPPFIFLSHEAQTLEVEPPQKIAAGRLNIRLLIRELDGSVTQKISASVFADCWIEVPVATTVLNRDDVLEPGMITFVRKNLAHLRGEIWDGRGGPWRVLRPIGLEQAIYRADLGHLPAVRKGSLITLLYEGKSLRLRAPGEALADGVPGESIPVRNSQSRKQLYGIVRDASTVITGAPL